jgi:hypothetical protein
MEHLAQLRTMAQRLSKANAALMVWDEIDAQRQSGVADTPALEPPVLSRQALKVQLVLLIADMCRLEQEICAAPFMSKN